MPLFGLQATAIIHTRYLVYFIRCSITPGDVIRCTTYTYFPTRASYTIEVAYLFGQKYCLSWSGYLFMVEYFIGKIYQERFTLFFGTSLVGFEIVACPSGRTFSFSEQTLKAQAPRLPWHESSSPPPLYCGLRERESMIPRPHAYASFCRYETVYTIDSRMADPPVSRK